MDGSAIDSLRAALGDVTDVRVQGRSEHLLIDILCITILAVLCGADDFVAMATFATSRREWLSRFFKLPGGIPSHDTFQRVLGLIDPAQFSSSLVNWTAALQTALRGQVIAIDGKTARGSASKSKGIRALHLVSAWATTSGLSMGQVAVDEKSNEITAIPELLDLLTVKGAVVTIDAMGLQREIVRKIREKEADYVIGLKGNQPTLLRDMEALLEEGCDTNFEGLVTDVETTIETARGGIEERTVRAIEIPADSPYRAQWEALRTLVVVLTRTEREGRENFETRFSVSSLAPNAKRLSQGIGSHWGIENTLHWGMDVTFGEDHHRFLNRNGVQNLSAIRRFAIAILRRDKKTKLGAKNKRFKAAMNPDYILEVLDNLSL